MKTTFRVDLALARIFAGFWCLRNCKSRAQVRSITIIGTKSYLQYVQFSGFNFKFSKYRDPEIWIFVYFEIFKYSHIFEFLSTKNFITDSKHSSDFQRTFKVSTSAMFALKNRQILIKNVKAKL